MLPVLKLTISPALVAQVGFCSYHCTLILSGALLCFRLSTLSIFTFRIFNLLIEILFNCGGPLGLERKIKLLLLPLYPNFMGKTKFLSSYREFLVVPSNERDLNSRTRMGNRVYLCNHQFHYNLLIPYWDVCLFMMVSASKHGILIL